MFSAIRTAASSRAATRAFSTSTRTLDVAKLTLIGRLGREPEVKKTKNDMEFVTYTVATNSYPPASADENSERPAPRTSWHRVLSFSEGSNRYLKTLKKGSLVYVEAAYELREPDQDADPSTPQGQRQIFLKHESIRVLSTPKFEEESP
ncbi:single-stranded dna-binding protein [Moniliophthora roreri MCA 2997]|uniref:Single-stranded dna-binding protein n=2 Tax=Moniliophthora roreri TaxID=221103 RepID=V2XJ24_MONRO|nr:single-stranded dna-binding protein [Moniliophthora roreri MCA 2997]KAI3596776.1 single-stranded dna-binding protein [Moniliophthora roreri]